MAFRFTEDGEFRGQVSFTDLVPSPGAISNSHVSSTAAIASSKLEQRNRQVYAQESNTAVADGIYVIHVAGAAGTIESVSAGCVVAPVGNNSTVSVDLLINGNSALNSAISITESQAARELVAGVLSTTTFNANAVIELSIDGEAGGGTLGKGLFSVLDIRENAP